MSVLTASTELDAVNEMLTSIGQAPVNTLEVQGIRDVNIAKSFLHSVNRSVQSRGWHFNTDRDFELQPDVDGEIAFPFNALSVDPEDAEQDYVRRGSLLYNRETKSFNFDEPVKVKVVWFLAFEDLPQSAREYIATSAARKFQAQMVGSQILYQYTSRDEEVAFAYLSRDEMRRKDVNMLSGKRH